jgi:hypothetical protein
VRYITEKPKRWQGFPFECPDDGRVEAHIWVDGEGEMWDVQAICPICEETFFFKVRRKPNTPDEEYNDLVEVWLERYDL